MKLKSLLFVLLTLAAGEKLLAQDYKELGKFAVTTNPLMPIMKGIPVVMDIRTGPVIHNFRYCYFWKHNTSNFYDVFNPLAEVTSFRINKGRELGYALKIPFSIVDNSSFFLYFAPQFINSDYSFSELPVRYLLKNSTTQVDQIVSGDMRINRYMAMLGMMIFPNRGFTLDVYISAGVRKFSPDFNETIPGTGNKINSGNVDMIKPEYGGEVFMDRIGRISMQSGFRFGIAL